MENKKTNKKKKNQNSTKTKQSLVALEKLQKKNLENEEILQKELQSKNPQSFIETTVFDQEDPQGFVCINGTFKEGGGQIIRNSLSLSVLTGRKVKIVGIRGNRSPPGLKNQHLEGVLLMKEMASAQVSGAFLGSSSLQFAPSAALLHQESWLADTKTAGSIGLLIQISLPLCLTIGKETNVDMRGGTNVDFSPPIDYLDCVFRPISSRMGLDFSLKVVSRGFFPRGGGKVFLNMKPIRFVNPLEMTKRGNVTKIELKAFVCGMDVELSQKAIDFIQNLLKKKLTKNILIQEENEIKEKEEEFFPKFENSIEKISNSPGQALILFAVAHTSTECRIAASSIGGKNPDIEKISTSLVSELINELRIGACVDEYLQDQLIIYMALAKGKSRILSGPLSLHTETSIHFSQLLTGAKFSVSKVSEDQKDKLFLIECEGIGYINKNLI